MQLLFFHGVDQLKQLAAIDHFHKWSSRTLVADYIQSGCVLQPKLNPTLPIGFDKRCKFPVRVNDKGQINLVCSSKFFSE